VVNADLRKTNERYERRRELMAEYRRRTGKRRYRQAAQPTAAGRSDWDAGTDGSGSQVDELMERIEGMVTDYDVTGVQDLVRGQVAIITALERERAALWAFVRAQRDYNVAVQEHANEGGDDFFLTWRSNINVVKAQESLIKAEAALAQYEEGSSS
jgi:hypothetical protein